VSDITKHDARIVRVREDETFPTPHSAYAVIACVVDRKDDGSGWERVWDVVLQWPREDDE
jgi:hypothetical protein